MYRANLSMSSLSSCTSNCWMWIPQGQSQSVLHCLSYKVPSHVRPPGQPQTTKEQWWEEHPCVWVCLLGFCCWVVAGFVLWLVFINSGTVPSRTRNSYTVQMADKTKSSWSQHRLSFIPRTPPMETHTLPPFLFTPSSTIKSIKAAA